jgi:hypothetical protein
MARPGQAAAAIKMVGVMILLIGAPIAYFVWPRGDRIGEIDLGAQDASLTIPATGKTRLLFRLDVEPGGRTVERGLSASTVLIQLEGSAVTQTTCPAIGRGAMSGSPSALEGIVLACELRLPPSGNVRVRARPMWAPGFAPRRAVLEVRGAD